MIRAVAEIFRDILSSTERASLDKFEEILNCLREKGAICGFSSNNTFDEDFFRGMVDYWVSTDPDCEDIPFCVTDGRHRSHKSIAYVNPGFPVVETMEDGRFKDDGTITNLVMAQIGLYRKNEMTMEKLLRVKRQKILKIKTLRPDL